MSRACDLMVVNEIDALPQSDANPLHDFQAPL